MMHYYVDCAMNEAHVFALLLWIVVFADLVLLGIWLWQRIRAK